MASGEGRIMKVYVAVEVCEDDGSIIIWGVYKDEAKAERKAEREGVLMREGQGREQFGIEVVPVTLR